MLLLTSLARSAYSQGDKQQENDLPANGCLALAAVCMNGLWFWDSDRDVNEPIKVNTYFSSSWRCTRLGDGRLITGHNDGTLRMWDKAGKPSSQTLREHPGGKLIGSVTRIPALFHTR